MGSGSQVALRATATAPKDTYVENDDANQPFPIPSLRNQSQVTKSSSKTA
ncbi:hypothetical protein VFPPC_15499 [Pochonia chlamydosporia 170]|uniref:Uncharacterized protein n=1 Tax=Pochonia chlamydosporia 170 TaxID=1380566 RepID=A0A179FW36_METCM|nr:hypothetical protein VFPPC_15499 [Pochonia chlamydosporia 170]OAQ69865.1 hypothetical protein VFPPC_15499 [Pochonia chlamydosporia 170]